jgi:hypothetical protein
MEVSKLFMEFDWPSSWHWALFGSLVRSWAAWGKAGGVFYNQIKGHSVLLLNRIHFSKRSDTLDDPEHRDTADGIGRQQADAG